ncbi:MAG: hypothetical protein ACPG47_07415 [Leucothrix sp.]
MPEQQSPDTNENLPASAQKRGFAYVVYIVLLIIGILLGLVYAGSLLIFITSSISQMNDFGLLFLVVVLVVATALHFTAIYYAVMYADTQSSLASSIFLLLAAIIGLPFVVFFGCVAVLS